MTNMITLEMVCPFCGETHTVRVRTYELEAYEKGALVQDAFPFLSATEREQLISQMCPTCQARVFEDFYEEPYDIEMGFDPYEGCYSFDC